MPRKGEEKLDYPLSVKVETAAVQKFIANAEACKSTKDIVLRELIYAFNRFCADGRFPVLQRLEIASPGYMIAEDGQSVFDAGPLAMVDEAIAAKKKRRGSGPSTPKAGGDS